MALNTPLHDTHEYDPNQSGSGVTRCGLRGPGLYIVSGESDDATTTTCAKCREHVEMVRELHLYHCAGGHTRSAIAKAKLVKLGFRFEGVAIYWPGGARLTYDRSGNIEYPKTPAFDSLSFDGRGINGRDQYRDRLATLTEEGLRLKVGPLFAASERLADAAGEALKLLLWQDGQGAPEDNPKDAAQVRALLKAALVAAEVL